MPTSVPETAKTVEKGSDPVVLLLALGTPDAPTPEAVRRYLAEFLWDRRVIDVARPLWWLILNLIVLRTRPAKSAALYKKVWRPEGSPLAVLSEAQARGLEKRLNTAHSRHIAVRVAMRYGTPSIASVLGECEAAGRTRILAFPMYPQYAGATTGSSLERLFEQAARQRIVPSIRVVPPYFDDPAYIAALAAGATRALAAAPAPPEHLVLSFHGLPQRYADAGDPYPAQCAVTADRVLDALGWPRDRATQTFQSRFGREPWLQPYSDVTLNALPSRGVTRAAVMCPGFTADCLETLEEIGMTGAEQFHEHGGRQFTRIPCVNDDDEWLDAMAAIATRELRGWL
jgi:ferrochelatase